MKIKSIEFDGYLLFSDGEGMSLYSIEEKGEILIGWFVKGDNGNVYCRRRPFPGLVGGDMCPEPIREFIISNADNSMFPWNS